MKWTDDDIETWAKIYSSKHIPLLMFEEKTGIPHATLHWCFMNRLPTINSDLYDQVLKRIILNKSSHIKEVEK